MVRDTAHYGDRDWTGVVSGYSLEDGAPHVYDTHVNEHPLVSIKGKGTIQSPKWSSGVTTGDVLNGVETKGEVWLDAWEPVVFLQLSYSKRFVFTFLERYLLKSDVLSATDAFAICRY